jgi:hypothetical protein
MYCPNCGMLNSDQAIFCANCRAEMAGAGVSAPAQPLAASAPPVTTVPPVAPPPVVPFRPESSTVRTLLGILAFVVPPAGLLMYYAWRRIKPRQARRLLNISVLSLALFVFLYILMIFISLATQIKYSY